MSKKKDIPTDKPVVLRPSKEDSYVEHKTDVNHKIIRHRHGGFSGKKTP